MGFAIPIVSFICAKGCHGSNWKTVCIDACKKKDEAACIAEATAHFAKKGKSGVEEAAVFVKNILEDAGKGMDYCTENQDACDFCA